MKGQSGAASPAMLLAGAVCLLALPSAVLAFASDFGAADSGGLDAHASMANFLPARVDPRLARSITVPGLTGGQIFHFTPAGSATRPDRSVTVAVRVDAVGAQAILVRAPRDSAASLAALRIAPTAYSLGVARGFQNFSLAGEQRRGDLPDFSSFKLRSTAAAAAVADADEPSRLNARIAFDEREKTGRAPRTLEGNGEQTVDVGGSYRVTGNLNVTAGVRYSQERDRMVPVIDGQKDGQAVYVGTQFRF
ncbi:hypothetical protein ACFOD9_13005 [Novosphingobium bradum]|uniref:Porin domain-containing protein n=1 Tax=Novosphingobium bradum TaxID=1737444 RepID=A0ABV7IT73_9SPHN